MPIAWQPRETRPTDGSPFWAWLYDSGIKKIRYWTPEQLAEEFGGIPPHYDPLFLCVQNTDDEYDPQFWCPLSEIPEPCE